MSTPWIAMSTQRIAISTPRIAMATSRIPMSTLLSRIVMLPWLLSVLVYVWRVVNSE